MSLERQILELAERARTASRVTGELGTPVKNAWLQRVAERLEAGREAILEANARDMREAEAAGVSKPLVNRLALSESKWRDMIQGVRDVAHLEDPVGEISEMRVRPNGLRVGRMRIPLGVVAMIYESRPNVTVDAAVLCVKAGNAVILRGGSEAIHSNRALGEELRAAAHDVGLPEDAVVVVPTTDRAAIDVMLQADRFIDLIIPRGGPGLIRKVQRESRIPVIAHDKGVCHVYIDASADAEMARRIAIDSKLRQMALCNGLETILCHREAAHTALPHVLKGLHEEGVEIRGCPVTCEVFGGTRPASDEDWVAEYLAPIVAVRVVDGLDAAIEHVRDYGSEHTDIIVTNNYASSQEWLRRLHSSVVGVNCSTAFSDGFRLGLGAEIGVSTSKLHAFGPMGLEGLTTRKFVLYGDGQLGE
ncbi:MAG: glutamate-5-semialdehyde dehydrogenase [Proteobacteria bacterium]|nr:glutamate-5-semialdehyde dehydrogenase [Pseudomonadota bacterium]